MIFRQATLLIVLLLVVISTAVSQSRQNSEADSEEVLYQDDNIQILEVTYDIQLPFGDYSRALNRNLNGFTGTYFTQSRSKQYSHLGIQFSIFRIGDLTNTIISGPDQFTDTTTSTALMARFIYRKYAPFYLPKLEPFLEASVGPHLYYTSTNTIFLDAQGGSSLNFDESDFGLSYGILLGTTIHIVDSILGVVKFGFHGGTATSFLVPSEELQTTFPFDSFQNEVEQLGYFSINFGLAYTF